MNKSFNYRAENILAHTCALGGANSVASMMFEIWTWHESESAQVHVIRSARTQQGCRMARVEHRLHGWWVKNYVLLPPTKS